MIIEIVGNQPARCTDAQQVERFDPAAGFGAYASRELGVLLLA
jgi:hypothetical protein